MLRVKSICKKRGITLKELANRMDVSPETVTRMLSSNGNPTLSTLGSIAIALDLNIYELFDDFNMDVHVKGYLEVNQEIHKVNNFKDLEQIYLNLKSTTPTN